MVCQEKYSTQKKRNTEFRMFFFCWIRTFCVCEQPKQKKTYGPFKSNPSIHSLVVFFIHLPDHSFSVPPLLPPHFCFVCLLKREILFTKNVFFMFIFSVGCFPVFFFFFFKGGYFVTQNIFGFCVCVSLCWWYIFFFIRFISMRCKNQCWKNKDFFFVFFCVCFFLFLLFWFAKITYIK